MLEPLRDMADILRALDSDVQTLAALASVDVALQSAHVALFTAAATTRDLHLSRHLLQCQLSDTE